MGTYRQGMECNPVMERSIPPLHQISKGTAQNSKTNDITRFFVAQTLFHGQPQPDPIVPFAGHGSTSP
jgi:hypothetical protein